MPVATVGDLTWCSAYLAGTAASWVIPQRADDWLSGLASRSVGVARGGGVERLARRMNWLMRRGTDTTPETLEAARRHYTIKWELAWGRVRARHGSYPRLRLSVEGLSRLQAAFAAGRGAILWRMRLCDAPIANMALAQEGIDLVHLSEAMHGVRSDSWFARRVNGPLYRMAEEHSVDERVVMQSEASVGYLRVLIERLSENRVLSIFGEQVSRQMVEASILGESVPLATGAPSLAWRSGALLVPLYVAWDGPLTYRIVLDEPIAVARDLERKHAVESAMTDFGARLEQVVREHPAEWTGWWDWPQLGIPWRH